MAKAKNSSKNSVDSKGIAARFLGACLNRLSRGDTFVSCLDFLEQKAKFENPNVTKDALKNCRGRWFEILLVFIANHQLQKNDKMFLKLGTANEHSIFDIFSDIGEVVAPDKFTINLSIPDMILLRGKASKELSFWKKQLLSYDLDTQGAQIVDHILTAYQVIKNVPIETKACEAFCSLKTSLRPDRKYQAMYEAESIRALQKRIPSWNVKYYMVGPLDANKTKAILDSNLSLIALADKHPTPYKTVDQIFVVNDLETLNGFIDVCMKI